MAEYRNNWTLKDAILTMAGSFVFAIADTPLLFGRPFSAELVKEVVGIGGTGGWIIGVILAVVSHFCIIMLGLVGVFIVLYVIGYRKLEKTYLLFLYRVVFASAFTVSLWISLFLKGH